MLLQKNRVNKISLIHNVYHPTALKAKREFPDNVHIEGNCIIGA